MFRAGSGTYAAPSPPRDSTAPTGIAQVGCGRDHGQESLHLEAQTLKTGQFFQEDPLKIQEHHQEAEVCAYALHSGPGGVFGLFNRLSGA